MKYHKSFFQTALASLLVVLGASRAPAQNEINIQKDLDIMGRVKPIPISISGFTGEVASVLNFDLEVMGFKPAAPDEAQYLLSGNNNGNVQGQLTDRFSKASLLSTVYSGASVRAQAHRLADDVVLKITGRKGIAETKIAFKAGSGRSSEIYIADFDGHNPQAVTRDGTEVAAPCWVPGHLALCYTSYKLGSPNIFFQNLVSGERQNIAHHPGMNSSAAVSPDGRKVAMILSKSGSPDVYVCDADGTQLKQLTATPEDESSPCWSPDGRWICFASKINERRGLYKVSVDGGSSQRIPTSGVTNPSEPDWSPDGKWIVFTAQMGGFDVCVVPAQGGAATPLMSGEDPCWAPNSRNVVFVRRAGGSRLLSLLDVPTKQVKDVSRVSGSNSNNSQPSWAR